MTMPTTAASFTPRAYYFVDFFFDMSIFCWTSESPKPLGFPDFVTGGAAVCTGFGAGVTADFGLGGVRLESPHGSDGSEDLNEAFGFAGAGANEGAGAGAFVSVIFESGGGVMLFVVGL